MSTPVPWLDNGAHAYKWTEKAYALLIAGRINATVKIVARVEVSLVTGPCPRCEHKFTDAQVHGAVAGRGTLGTDRVETVVREIDLWCDCGQEHPGRPGGRKGCGVAYRVPATLKKS